MGDNRMKKKNAIDQFFDRQEPINYPLPKSLKPYTRVATSTVGAYIVRASHKDSGSAKIELIQEGEVVEKLFIQGIDYAELTRESLALQHLVRQKMK